MIPRDYFQRPDTPSLNSPVGRIMRDLAYLYPHIPAEELRELANTRIHSGGPQKVKWTKDESQRLKNREETAVAGAGGRRKRVSAARTQESGKNRS